MARDWRDIGRPEGLEAYIVAPIVRFGDDWRLARHHVHTTDDGVRRHFLPLPAGAITAVCKDGCGEAPPRGYGGCPCGVWAHTRPDEALAGLLYPPTHELVGRALLHVTLHGPVYPLKGADYDAPVLVKAAEARVARVLLHAGAPQGFCPVQRRRIGADELAEALQAHYPAPVEVGAFTAADLPCERDWDHAEVRPAGVGWRATAADYTSPFYRDRPLTTRPGEDAVDEDGRGVFLSREPMWLAHTVAYDWSARLTLVSFDESDVLETWNHAHRLRRRRDHELTVRRLHVIGEASRDEIAELASGCDPAPIIARIVFGRLGEETEPRAGIHGREHLRRVFANGLELAAATPGADVVVVGAFAALHDGFRLSDGRDPHHGARAADAARRLRAEGVLPLDDDQLDVLCRALVDHDRGHVSGDPTIGASWDADRLDLRRIGIRPRAALLSTAAGKRRCAA